MTTIASDTAQPGTRHFWLGMAAYLVPTFPIAFVWHLVLFEQSYHALGIYRADPIIPFGLASMIIQAGIFSWAFPRLFPRHRNSMLKSGLLFGVACCPGRSRRLRSRQNIQCRRSRTMSSSNPPSLFYSS